MSEDPRTAPEPADNRPRPESIRFYGTSWLDHSRLYGPRRFALGLGAVLLATVGALVLRLVHEGMRQAESAGWLRMLIIVAFALCSAMAFTRTWSSYTRPLDSRAEEHSFRSIKVIGFLGVLLAYAVRSAVEAPGEKLLRQDYEAAVRSHERVRTRRSRHPARRGKRKR
jgi:hypothetical protein